MVEEAVLVEPLEGEIWHADWLGLMLVFQLELAAPVLERVTVFAAGAESPDTEEKEMVEVESDKIGFLTKTVIDGEAPTLPKAS